MSQIRYFPVNIFGRRLYPAIVLIFIICILGSCLAKPQQPPLTIEEFGFFKRIATSCRCEIEREVYVKRRLEEKQQTNDYYLLGLYFTDSLGFAKSGIDSNANLLAKTLNDSIIEVWKKDKIKITIVYHWKRGPAFYTSKIFEYPVGKFR